MRMVWEKDGKAVEVRNTSVGRNPAGGAWTELHLRKGDVEQLLRMVDNLEPEKTAQWLRDMLARNVAPDPLPEGTITEA